MASSVFRSFTDPYEHQKSIRVAEAELFITKPGEYRAELTRIDLHRLWLQDGRTNLPHLAHHALRKERSVIFFLVDPQQVPIHHSGLELSPGEIMVDSVGSDHHQRVPAESHWGSMSLTPDDLAAAGETVAGIELIAPLANRKIRPPHHLMTRLLNLHRSAVQLAATVPDILAQTEVAKAIEQESVRFMVACLTEGVAPGSGGSFSPHRLPVMRRFEQMLERHHGRPLYLTEICAAIGVADRTLRLHCLEHLGMSPHRYLWLRRMNLTRRALAIGDPASTTVTEIATGHGFWELGRFAVAYRKLFGESPSTTLRRLADVGPPAQILPL